MGGYAVILHGYTHPTGDMDIWVNPVAENYKLIFRAFQEFGMPVFDMTEERFLDTGHFDVFTFGVRPNQIDLLTQVKGLVFAAAFERADITEVDGIPIRVLSRGDLTTAKRAAGRPRDLDDLENLP